MVQELILEERCRSEPATPAGNLYQQKRHPNAQSKLRFLNFIENLNQNFHVHPNLSHLYTDPFYLGIVQ